MPKRRAGALVIVGALLMAACSGSGSGDAQQSLRDAVLGTSTTTPPPPTTTDPALEGLAGLIATTDRAGVQLVDPATGQIEAEFVRDGIVTQPTWSRDGTQLVAMAFDPATGAGHVVLVDPLTATSREVPAARPYFFFTWSHDGTRIAALGPGSVGSSGPPRTSLDILDSDGEVISTGSLEGGSLYVAWEPEGDGLLAHVDDDLLLVDDTTDLTATRLLASPGALFQAAAWIPGSRSALIAVDDPTGTRLERVDVDTGDKIDFGFANDFVSFTVARDGRSAVLAHSPNPGAGTDGPGETVSVSFRASGHAPEGAFSAATEISSVVEILDLTTGERTPVSDVPALWVEWNPAGTSVAAYLIDGSWAVWADGELTRLAQALPTDIFFTRYIAFSGQYIETPRLWSPDGLAITYAANTGAESRFFVLLVDDDPATNAVDIGAANVSFWSPAASG